ncbi:MAG: hypothetical protein ACFB6S_16060 [Geminicoccaceae bacterium]
MSRSVDRQSRPEELPDDQALVALANDRAFDRLAKIYLLAGESWSAKGDIDQACFFWTQAYVLALDAGNESVSIVAGTRLMERGRLARA